MTQNGLIVQGRGEDVRVRARVNIGSVLRAGEKVFTTFYVLVGFCLIGIGQSSDGILTVMLGTHYQVGSLLVVSGYGLGKLATVVTRSQMTHYHAYISL